MGHRGGVGSRFEQIALSATLQAQSARPESIRTCCNLLSSFLFLSIFESVWRFLFFVYFCGGKSKVCRTENNKSTFQPEGAAPAASSLKSSYIKNEEKLSKGRGTLKININNHNEYKLIVGFFI